MIGDIIKIVNFIEHVTPKEIKNIKRLGDIGYSKGFEYFTKEAIDLK